MLWVLLFVGLSVLGVLNNFEVVEKCGDRKVKTVAIRIRFGDVRSECLV